MKDVWSNLKVRTKLLGLVGMFTVALVAVGGVALAKQATLYSAASDLGRNWMPSVDKLGRLDTLAAQHRFLVYRHITTVDDAAMADVDKLVQAKRDEYDAMATEYEALISSDEERQAWDTYVAAWTPYMAAIDGILTLSRANKNDEATTAMLESKKLYDVAEKALKADQDYNNAGAERSQAAAKSASDSARLTLIVVIAIAVLIGAAVAWVIARSIIGRISATNRVLGRVAERDLTVRVGDHTSDEFGEMAASLDAALDATQQAIASIAQYSVSLAGSAEEMAAVSTQLQSAVEVTNDQIGSVSAAAVQASASVGTVAASAEEMSSTVREITRSVTQATEVIQQASVDANQASTVIAQLGEASQQIGQVVNFITTIAEQTNLLALNATIEAARAGEAGRGFAVVASEVKDLAQKTSQATDEIRETIDMLQRGAANAVTAIERVSHVMGEVNSNQLTIGGAVEEQAATTDEITRNAGEVAGATEAIAANISTVAAATADTGASSSQVNQAANDVARMATELSEVVSRFTYA